MERLQELITRLKEQSDQGSNPSQMLITTQLIEAELNRQASQAVAGKASAKVAVMMPSAVKIPVEQQSGTDRYSAGRSNPLSRDQWEQNDRNPYEREPSGVEQKEQAGQRERTEQKEHAGQKERAEQRERLEQKERAVQQERELYEKDRKEGEQKERTEHRGQTEKKERSGQQGGDGLSFDPLNDIPTLAQQHPRELNDVIGHNGASLNDKLKVNVLDLAAALNDTPVRDLKKAIGVNDRYVFISELFRGDEVMYERSIKTINSFRILPEAEYWMERELKVKLGWDENRETTRHFYQLVKRRFS